MSAELIDTTEMYLKTIFELEEDGIPPLRARIVERLGHSGPTVSQTVGRMERDGLVTVREDRRLELTEVGRTRSLEVMRKHRLAERLLVDVIGLEWADAHEEACRWEHVISAKVEERLSQLLGDPATDPYGNPVPGSGQADRTETSLEGALPQGAGQVTLSRIGEPLQAQEGLLQRFAALGLRPGTEMEILLDQGVVRLRPVGSSARDNVALDRALAHHLFVVADGSGL